MLQDDDGGQQILGSAVRDEGLGIPVEEMTDGLPLSLRSVTAGPLDKELLLSAWQPSMSKDLVDLPLIDFDTEVWCGLLEVEKLQGRLRMWIVEVWFEMAAIDTDGVVVSCLDDVAMLSHAVDDAAWAYPVRLQLLARAASGSQPPRLVSRLQRGWFSAMGVDLSCALGVEVGQDAGDMSIHIPLPLKECDGVGGLRRGA